MERDSLSGSVVVGQGAAVLNLRRVDAESVLQEFVYGEGGETLEEVTLRSCACSLPGSLQGQVGWGFEQPGLLEGVLARIRWSELDDH